MKPGQKVVLVDDNWPPGTDALYAALPVKGPTYVVRDVFPATSLDATPTHSSMYDPWEDAA